jgi:two-component system, chemotaxis family, CheB/CheR fusion protein
MLFSLACATSMIGEVDQAALEPLLEHLRQVRGFDFTAYKRSTLTRRIVKRMEAAGIRSVDRYREFLDGHPDEFNALFNTILINVTSFFRDADVWEGLRDDVLPPLVGSRGAGEQIRVWSAGCAAGQEPYSIVMLFAELIGIDAVRERLKVYATDVDQEALAEARRAVFTEKQLADVPGALAAKYFEGDGDHRAFHRDLRRCVIFGRHDLIQDPPISRVDLLLCRNTLMYFNSDAQSRIMARFHFSLRPGGLLLLGRAEMLFSYIEMFQPVDMKRRIFRIAAKAGDRAPAARVAKTAPEETMPEYSHHSRLRDAAFDMSHDAQIIIDGDGRLAAANDAAKRQFKIGNSMIGALFQDLELSYRPAELRPRLDDALQERHDVTVKDVPWEYGGRTRYLDVTISPLFEGGALLGTRITFVDVTHVKALQDELWHSKHDLETAYEELQSTNEELETTNEELQSTVEELETTNEELQSTNEELETMNEELQSTNEELQTMNDELRNRSHELDASNAFLESVFSSLGTGVIVIDRDLRVDVWNARSTELWGVRADEARKAHFFNLEFGLPVAELHQPIREVLVGGAASREMTLSATNRKGRALQCRVSISPLHAADGSTCGAIMLMEEVPNSPPDAQPRTSL